MSQRSSLKPNAVRKATAEIVTYRLDNEMVYVTPAADFEQAVNYAHQAFPQLAHIAPERIGFAISVRVNGTPRTVRIAPMAWRKVVSQLTAYEIIDVCVVPEQHNVASRATKSDTDVRRSALDEAPPSYPSEKTNFTPSTSFSLTVPEPPQRSRSALGWFGRHL